MPISFEKDGTHFYAFVGCGIDLSVFARIPVSNALMPNLCLSHEI